MLSYFLGNRICEKGQDYFSFVIDSKANKFSLFWFISNNIESLVKWLLKIHRCNPRHETYVVTEGSMLTRALHLVERSYNLEILYYFNFELVFCK